VCTHLEELRDVLFNACLAGHNSQHINTRLELLMIEAVQFLNLNRLIEQLPIVSIYSIEAWALKE